MFTFTVQGKPIPQGSISVMRGRALPSNYRALSQWRKALAVRIYEAKPADWDNTLPLAVAVDFHFARPKSHLTKKGLLRRGAPARMQVRPDLDKLVRAVGDALTDAGAVKDDSLIVSWCVRKYYGGQQSGLLGSALHCPPAEHPVLTACTACDLLGYAGGSPDRDARTGGGYSGG